MGNNVFVYTCKGVGYGNQTWFIPAIRHFEKQGNLVYTNSTFLNQVFDVSLKGPKKPDAIYVPMWPPWGEVLKLLLKYPTVPKYGFTYRVLGKHYSLGYAHALKTDLYESEHEQIQKLTKHEEPFKIRKREQTIKNRIVISASDKPKNRYPFHLLKQYLIKDGYDVVVLGEMGRWVTDLHDVRVELEHAEYYIGTDSGIMHLADILGSEGLVLWGQTPDKNKPLHLKIVDGGLKMSPKEVYACCQNLLFS